MIISRGRRYIFVHIPKTGGTALSLALEERAMKDDILIGDTPKAHKRQRRLKDLSAKGRLWKHSTLADLDGLVTPGDMAAMFVFSLVRNPWDRMVSYYHWLRMQAFDHPAVALAKLLDFGDFLRHPTTETAMAVWPYGAYLRDAQGREHCDAWIRLEHLQTDLAPVEDHLGFRLDNVAVCNASARDQDYRGYYDDALAEHVATLCRPDIERFGYRFG